MRSLSHRMILLVEDEPLLAMEVEQALEAAGAQVTTVTSLKHARILVEHEYLAAAVLDHRLLDGNADCLCTRLNERRIPFILCSGLPDIDGPCCDAPLFSKPVNPNALVQKLVELMSARLSVA